MDATGTGEIQLSTVQKGKKHGVKRTIAEIALSLPGKIL